MAERRRIEAKRFMTPTAIGGHDFTCNPYVGCTHGCLYCYAKKLGDQPTRPEPWGSFVEIKHYPNYDIPRNTGSKSLFFSSATDAWQPIEREEHLTRDILEAIRESRLRVSILTKSALVVRDLDILRSMPEVEVGFSIATADADACLLEPGASRPSERLDALRQVHAAGIRTYVFVSPILPGITDPFAILDAAAPAADAFLFDTLNLRNPENRLSIFRHVLVHRPELMPLYRSIFEDGEASWYNELRERILAHCRLRGVPIRYLYDRR